MLRRDFLWFGAGAAAARWLPAAPEPRRVLYVSGSIRAQVAERLAPTRFNTLILAFVYARWHAGRLALTWNGTPGARLGEAAAELRRLRGRRVLASLGGWGNAATFAAIRSAGVERFLDQFDRELAEPLGLRGIDLDLEPGTVAENTPAGWRAVHEEYGGLLVALTKAYARRHPGHAVTHAPIAGVAASLYARDGKLAGVRGSLIEATAGSLSWLNVQFYEAGDPKPESIVAFYKRELMDPLRAARPVAGWERPWERVLPGFEPKYQKTRAACSAALAGIGGELGPARRLGGYFL
ncbi:MAG TPA: glycosyl hydrolase family 18 protein, partial [Terriglobales bacterium]|nr:glycosyl hydrolase family 18 protein [Terriglobales bacterium]